MLGIFTIHQLLRINISDPQVFLAEIALHERPRLTTKTNFQMRRSWLLSQFIIIIPVLLNYHHYDYHAVLSEIYAAFLDLGLF